MKTIILRLAALCLLAPAALRATPSGLNNIPTTETTPQGTWVSKPTDGGDASFTLKLNWVLAF